MQIVFLIAICFVFNALAETSPQTENLQTNTQKTVNVKKEKFSYLLNLLKSAITDEDNKNIENLNLIREYDTESIRNQLETELKEIQNSPENTKIENKDLVIENKDLKIENDAVLDKTFDKILAKISTAIDNKEKNNTQMKNINKNTEMPSMIPIFKPRKAKMASKSNQISSQLKNNFNTKAANFNIPCHRATDVLEFSTQTLKNVQGNIAPITNAIGNVVPCQDNSVISKNVHGNITPITNTISNKIPCQETSITAKNVQGNVVPIAKAISKNVPCKENPVISVNCKDVDESVKMLFKPKAISLMQLHGNLLKKTTVTVLVPYHISKMKS